MSSSCRTDVRLFSIIPTDKVQNLKERVITETNRDEIVREVTELVFRDIKWTSEFERSRLVHEILRRIYN